MAHKGIPRTMAISAGEPGRGWVAWLEELAATGVDALQLREKSLDDRDLYELARRLVALAAGRLQILVNGRTDLALAAGADGVHLPADGLPAAPLRPCLPAGFLVGRSAHDALEVTAAREEGCDYALFGPVKPTPSKAGRTDLPGFAGLAAAVAAGLPILALGGIETPEDLDAAADAGAAGVAGIRAFLVPDGAAALAAAARRRWPRGVEA